jgi:hypothetical protein
MKDDARIAFPSLFPRHRKARPLAVPEELENQKVSFDLVRIEKWKRRVKAVKKEISEMNENAVASEAAEATNSGSSRVTVNFFIPEGVSPEDLTLANYREVTEKRYRMTKDQVERGISREEAFEESKALAIRQLRGSN